MVRRLRVSRTSRDWAPSWRRSPEPRWDSCSALVAPARGLGWCSATAGSPSPSLSPCSLHAAFATVVAAALPILFARAADGVPRSAAAG